MFGSSIHIRSLLNVGVTALTLCSLASPYDLSPCTVPIVIALLALRNRAVYRAVAEWDARASSLILDVCMGAVFVFGVGRWTVGPSLIIAGFLLNHIAIAANGFAMPILGSPDPPPCYVRIGPATRLRWLGDIFITEGGQPHRALYSVGDAVITVGLWVFTAELLLAWQSGSV